MRQESNFDWSFFGIGYPAIFRVNVKYLSRYMWMINGVAISVRFGRNISAHFPNKVVFGFKRALCSYADRFDIAVIGQIKFI